MDLYPKKPYHFNYVDEEQKYLNKMHELKIVSLMLVIYIDYYTDYKIRQAQGWTKWTWSCYIAKTQINFTTQLEGSEYDKYSLMSFEEWCAWVMGQINISRMFI